MKGKSVNGWIAQNIRTVITIVVIIIGFTATATTLSVKVGSNETNITDNAVGLSELRETVTDDISDLKGDMKEIKAIVYRIERMIEDE